MKNYPMLGMFVGGFLAGGYCGMCIGYAFYRVQADVRVWLETWGEYRAEQAVKAARSGSRSSKPERG